MEKHLKYRSTIKSRPFFYIETKKLAELILHGLNDIEIKRQVMDENIFQVKTEARKREIASTILQRLKVLDEPLLKGITSSDVSSSKLIVLYAILKTDRLFYEFMNEVLSEKITYKDFLLTDRDFHLFFESKRGQSEVVASWKEYTFYKLQQVYIRILFEAGLLKNQKGEREISIPFIDQDILEHIRKNDDPKFIQVIVGGESER